MSEENATTEMKLVDYKALAYDTLARIEQLQMQLRELNMKIAELSK